MLTKRNVARKSSAAAAAMVSAKRPRRASHKDSVNHSDSNKAARRQDGSSGSGAVMEVEDERRRGAMLHALGEHINTRLREIHTTGGGAEAMTDDLAEMDQDVFEEKRRALMAEAELAAGTRQRVVSTAIAKHFSQSATTVSNKEEQSALELIRVRHNSNAVTALATLGDELVVFGDKSGKVYIAALQPHTSSSTSSSSEALMQGQKIMLRPAMRAAVGAIAVSDTRSHRPSTRELFEKTTVDMSCPSYIAVGAANGAIAIWETLTQTFKGLLTMHHKPITGLSFRALTSTLYSCSADATLRVWSVPQMLSMDKLFGHEGPVTGIHALRKETCVTAGEDGTMRFWKIDAATQQSYEYRLAHRTEAIARLTGALTNPADTTTTTTTKASRCPIALECVAMLNESLVIVGAMDGSVVVFDIGRSRPLVVIPAAHGYGFVGDGTGLEATALRAEHNEEKEEQSTVEGGVKGALQSASITTLKPVADIHDRQRQNANPITAVATVAYADVVATASYDGVVRLWQFVTPHDAGSSAKQDHDNKAESRTTGKSRLVPLATLNVGAIVTTLSFAPAGDVLFVGCSKEPRCGRWVVWSAALNSVCVIPLTQLAATRLGRQARQIEHVPALLYGFTDDKEAEEDEEEEEGNEGVTKGKSHTATSTADKFTAQDNNAAMEEDEGNSEDEEGTSGPSMLQVGADGQLVLNEDALRTIHRDEEGQSVMKRKKKKKKKNAIAAKKSKTVATGSKTKAKRDKVGGKKKKVKKVNKKLLAKTLGSAPP